MLGRGYYAVHIGLLLSLVPSSALKANVAQQNRQVLDEVGEVDRLSRSLAELCVRLGPEIERLHSDLSKKYEGSDNQIKILRPVAKQLSERLISVDRIRTEYSRYQGISQGMRFILDNSPKGAKILLQQWRHHILHLQLNQVPEAEARLESQRTELRALMARGHQKSWEEYFDKKEALELAIEKSTGRVTALSEEVSWLIQAFQNRTTFSVRDLAIEEAVIQSQIGILRNQLVGEEMTLRSLQSKTATLERELGRRSPTPAIPPFLPAVCERMR